MVYIVIRHGSQYLVLSSIKHSVSVHTRVHGIEIKQVSVNLKINVAIEGCSTISCHELHLVRIRTPLCHLTAFQRAAVLLGALLDISFSFAHPAWHDTNLLAGGAGLHGFFTNYRFIGAWSSCLTAKNIAHNLGIIIKINK